MSLDLTSTDFDPAAALSNPEDVVLPIPNARPFNNLAEYVSRTRGLGRSRGSRALAALTQRAQPSTSGQWTTISAFGRARLEKLQATLTPKPEERLQKDVLNLMPTKTGPLAFLHKCVTNRLKIKVWTRNFTEIRGICTGYLVVFDKHWNLAMRDVDETYLRPVKRKTPPMGPPPEVTQQTWPPPRPIDHDGKTQRNKWIQRHVNQLFVRGDNIVTIAVAT